MKNKIIICFFSIILTSSLYAFKSDNFFNINQKEEPKIFINNRILARVNGKPISTFDLMKKMDLTFYRQFPQYTSSIELRVQFYDMSWEYVLEDMIDKELILADAKESKIEVSAGDIRQEMEASFGPNIIANLDKAGITFDEAAKIMQEEIIIQKMISGRVHVKAIRQVTPSKIRHAYEEFIQNPENARLTQWSYRIVTIKDRNIEKAEEIAKAAYEQLLKGVHLDELENTLKHDRQLGRRGKINISDMMTHNDKEITEEYRQILSELDKGQFSQPFEQKSRKNRSTVYRILVMNEKIPASIPSLKEMEAVLKDKLLNEVVDQETHLYLNKLRNHYHVRQKDIEAYLPPNYQPFILG